MATFDLIFNGDPPPEFVSGVEDAANILSSAITNPITVNLTVNYGGTGRGAAAVADIWNEFSYDAVRSALKHASALGANTLPEGTIYGFNEVLLSSAQEKALGFIAPDAPANDGTLWFNTDVPAVDLLGLALHEITHALGRIALQNQIPGVLDFYSWKAPNERAQVPVPYDGGNEYFSLDHGHTNLAYYGQGDTADFRNVASDPFSDVVGGDSGALTALDRKQMAALGYAVAKPHHK